MILFPASRCFLMLGLELELDLPEFLWHLSPTQWFLNHQYCSGVLWAQPFLLVLVVILFLSQPLCFEPELALLKLLLNPIALVAKICCWKILILTVFKALIFFFHDRFTCICEAHRSFHKPTDRYSATCATKQMSQMFKWTMRLLKEVKICRISSLLEASLVVMRFSYSLKEWRKEI